MPLLPYAHSGWMVNVRFSPGHMSSTKFIHISNHLNLNHVQELTALVPTLDNLTLADVEAQRLPSVVTGIKLLATILKGTAVVNLDLVTCLFTPSASLQRVQGV